MIASLGMYDRAETAGPNDRFWAQIAMALRAQGLTAPEVLTRGPAAYWPAWEAPSLVLSQTCGFPFRARLRDRVALVATPDYGIEGCPAGYYASGAPFGLIFLGKQWSEAGLLTLAHAYEQATTWRARRPAMAG